MNSCKAAVRIVLALAASTVSTYALAQTAPAQNANQNAQNQNPQGSDQLTEVIVTGVRASVQSALEVKKESDQFQDSIVAEDVGKLPDNNVIEALQHVTGVQISRNAAEADQLLIRGLPDIATTLNGRDIFTSTGRFITLQDVPAELLSRVDVVKSPRADDIEGGIAGLIDVRLHRPFDFDGFQAAGTLMETDSNLSKNWDPRASLLLSDRWQTSIGEFGLLGDVSINKDRYKEEILDNYISSQTVGPVAGSTGPGGVAFLPLTEGGQSINGNRQRLSANLSAQFAPNSNTEFYAEGFYTRYRNPNNDDFFVGLPWIGANPATATVFPGSDEIKTVTAGNYDLTSDQSFVPRTDTFQLAMGGKWTGEMVTASSEVDYTNSHFNQVGYILDTQYTPPANGYTTDFNYNNTGTPYISVTGINLQDPANFAMRQLYDQWQDERGNEIDWRGDLKFKFNNDNLTSLDTGIRFADRFARNREDNQGGLDCLGTPNAASPTNPQLLAAMASAACFTPLSALPGTAYHVTGGSLFNGNFGLRNWLDADPQWLVNNIVYLRELFGQPGTPPPADPTQSFDDREISYAAYVKANFKFLVGSDPVTGNVGLRAVYTHANMVGNSLLVSSPDNVNFNFNYLPASTIENETDWLPSLNAKMELADGLFLRLAGSKTVTRPSFAQLNPGLSLSASTATLLGSGSSGNPLLAPERSTNADLGLEYYFGHANAVSATGFYRWVNGYIQSGVKPETIASIVYQVTTPVNAPEGHISGVEVGYTQFADFLPGWLSGFGFQTNGTYVSGAFQNISKYSFNAIGIYEYSRVSLRLAYNWRSGFDVGPAPGGGNQPSEIFSVAQPWLDFSANFRVADQLFVTFDATNLLDSHYQDYFGNQAYYPRDTRRFDQTFTIGLRYKLR